MKLIIRIAAILLLVSITGCGKDKDKDDKPVKAVDPEVLKTQLDTLKQAKQVDQVIQDAAQQQRQKTEEATQ